MELILSAFSFIILNIYDVYIFLRIFIAVFTPPHCNKIVPLHRFCGVTRDCRIWVSAAPEYRIYSP